MSTAVLVALALLPFLLLATTSFMKLSIVFSVLRNALGTGDVPSGAVVTVLSAILTAFVMLPVAREVVLRTAPFAPQVDLDAPFSGDSSVALRGAFDAGSEPLRRFLDHNAGKAERTLFSGLLKQALPEADRTGVRGDELSVVVPAFFVTELSEALQIAFLVLLPFLVLDLSIATILAALGMHALSPAVVALPFKLLLLVAVDGLRMLIEALVSGYA